VAYQAQIVVLRLRFRRRYCALIATAHSIFAALLCTADAVMTTTTEETTTAVVTTTVETTALPTTTIDATTTFQPTTTIKRTTTLATTTPSEYNCIFLFNSICVG